MGDSLSPLPAALAPAPDLHILTLVGDEDSETAQDIVSILNENGLMTSVVSAADSVPAEVRDADVVIIRVAPDGAGAALVSEVRGTSNTTRIVVVVPTASPRELRELLAAGADGLVTDAGAGDALAVTLRAVCAGQIAVPRDLWERAAKPHLSIREKQSLAMVVMGFSNGEIARKLFVTEATVKSHLSSAFAKLGVRSRAEATTLILDPEHGLGTGILAISDGAR